jgi:hypothetical protein
LPLTTAIVRNRRAWAFSGSVCQAVLAQIRSAGRDMLSEADAGRGGRDPTVKRRVRSSMASDL